MAGRITNHPILPPLSGGSVSFSFEGRTMTGRQGEPVASALYANGVRIFGHHPRDGGPQGIFCANGQCSQCLMIVNGKPVKSCMEPLAEGMVVEACEGLPVLPTDDRAGEPRPPEEISVDVLVVGGGPAGISAATELGRAGLSVLLIDDKAEIGGKLTLQTHTFFGSIRACHAGSRGIDITGKLAAELPSLDAVEVWTNTTAVGVFADKAVGLVREKRYILARPKVLLVAAGAREKSLSFPGADLPGVYGAGAFQTLVNRDLVKAARRLFIVGGGNVGLIGGYHALQAGIDVVGLVEALPQVGGYKVHLDKLRRLGVPIWTSHTVVRAEGTSELERVVVARCDERFSPIEGTFRAFDIDTLLIAVGLSPVDELMGQAEEAGLPLYAAGDAAQIAEASAAIFSGKIVGRTMARDLGRDLPLPESWGETAAVLRSRPGRTEDVEFQDPGLPVFPVISCLQEIPCNPCTQVCPVGSITIPDGSITSRPVFSGDCLGCARCVVVCPGLAIRLVEKGRPGFSLLTLPWEFSEERVLVGERVQTVDLEGQLVGDGLVVAVKDRKDFDRRRLLVVEVPEQEALAVAGFRIQQPEMGIPAEMSSEEEDPIVCRCERIRRSEIVAAIRSGITDYNVLKAVTRASMGGCGGKTCRELVMRLFRQEGVAPDRVTPPTVRPLVTEVRMDLFAGLDQGDDGETR